MIVRSALTSLLGEVIKVRRELHLIPEEGLKEFKTSEYIKEYLNKLGYTAHGTAGTGVYIHIEGKDNGSCTAFRADMDGLSVKEENEVEFASRHENMMHACGHDGHMTILLLLAKYIKDNNILPDTNILLIFQPAEEGPGGAAAIVKEGILQKHNVSEIFGCHLMPDVSEGLIAVRPGEMMAQTGEFYIEINGKSSHAAVPHKGIDAIMIAANLVNTLQTIVSRNIDPIKTSLLSVGTINGGERVNVVAKTVNISGTMRSYEEKVYNEMKKRMLEIVEGFNISFNCDIKCSIIDMYPPVYNDEKLYKKFISVLDEDEYVTAKPMMIAEDFSYYQKAVPGVFFYLGSYNEEKDYKYSLHDCRFNFDEKILLNAVELYMRLINRKR
ncbi:MAG: N-acetyldiaminopimelate deacetylase [Eubacteriaceae bacterium]|nr:N-acetyldiaminopimelate deacetylase [Eubacteriaceae bacterium]